MPGNAQRNKIAQTLDQSQIRPKMDELRVAFLAVLTSEQAEGVERKDSRVNFGALRGALPIQRITRDSSQLKDVI